MSVIDPEKLDGFIKEARQILYTMDAFDMSWKPMLIALAAASEAHLSTLPRVKEVEVWRVEYAYSYGSGHEPVIAQYRSHELALNHQKNLGPAASCITVTGPHRQKVPA
jgi:hypothetical protein